MAQLILILRRHHRHLGHAAQICVIEDAVVSVAIITDQACSIKTQGYVESLHTNIVQHGVIGALQEGTIDSSHGLETRCGGARSGGHRVLLSDAHVEEACRMGLSKGAQACAVRHGRGNANDILVLIG